MNPKVDFFFNDDGKWKNEYARLRQILLASELTEELKWGVALLSSRVTIHIIAAVI